MSLSEKFISLKQKTSSITNNPLLDCFDHDELKCLDEKAVDDPFIAGIKKEIINLIKELDIDFSPKLKSAYDKYSEALTYMRLSEKFATVEKVAENDSKTPDFKVEFDANYYGGDDKHHVVYAELKSMSYTDGDLNYKDTMDQGLNAQIDIEAQHRRGESVGFGIIEYAPLHKRNRYYDITSTRYAIEVLIEKIEQNLKREQFNLGETILIVDLKQLGLPNRDFEAAVPIFQEKRLNSFVSGIQWHVAFGKIGYLIHKQIESEGRESTDGELERDGIFTNREWIKAIVFLDFPLRGSEPKVIGLRRHRGTSEAVESFLHKFCDFINDDKNTNGWRLNDNEQIDSK